MRLLGGGLLAGAGLWCGILAAAQLRRSAARCGSLCGMLELIAFEIARFRTPLPELFASLSERLTGPPGALCSRAAAGLQAGLSFRAVWRGALHDLPAAEREILLPLGDVLGSFGAEEQTAGLDAALFRMRALERERTAALRDRTRVCVGVCSAGGLLMAVLLL